MENLYQKSSVNYFIKSFQNLSEKNSPSSFYPFNENSASALDNWLESIKDHYAAYKKQFPESHEHASKEKEFAFISTPHPIGNVTAVQCIMLDLMSKIENLQLRDGVSNKYDATEFKNKLIEYLDKARWGKDEMEKFDQAIDSAKNLRDQEQLKQYKELAIKSNQVIRDLIVEQIYKLDVQSKEEIKKFAEVAIQPVLAKLVLEIGIPTEVINREVQNLQNQKQEKIIQNKDEYSVTKSWVNVDADGDSANPMSNILAGEISESDNLKEIFIKQKETRHDNHLVSYEPRISYEDKKGVKGIKRQLEEIFNSDNLREINSISDLLNEDKFEAAYKEFRVFLENTKYQSSVSNKLDFIIRLCAPAFKRDASGIVLSDFDSSDTAIMPRLVFIKEAVEKYLKEENLVNPNFKISQSILPLCESEKSIKGAINAFGKFLGDVETEYSKTIESNDLNRVKEIKKLVCNKNGEFIYGFFAGPSDLTKDMGGLSTLLIDTSIRGANQMWNNFVESWDKSLEAKGVKSNFTRSEELKDKHLEDKKIQENFQKSDKPWYEKPKIEKKIEEKEDNLFMSGTKFVIEYGRGTSPKRGGGIVVPGLHGATVQGTTMPTFSNTLLKAYSKAATHQGLESDMAKSNIITDEFFNAAVENHRGFLNSGENGGEPGSVIKEFDKLRINPEFVVLDRKYNNNQGTRGADGIPTFANQRAINAASTTTYIGLISFPSFPAPGSKGWDEFNLEKMLSDPHGIDILTKELFQYCGMDFKRAGRLGFSNEVINQNQLYTNNVLSKLFTSVDPDFNLTQLNDLRYDQIASKLLDEILTSKMPLDSSAKKSLEHFGEQISFIANSRDSLSAMVNHLPTEGKANDSLLSNMAFQLNNLSNFQLPLIPAVRSKEEINTKYWEAHKPNTKVKVSSMTVEKFDKTEVNLSI